MASSSQTEARSRNGEGARPMLLNFFLAFVGIAWAVVFGIFSILSWKSSERANELAEFANLVALTDLCNGAIDDQEGALRDICSATSSAILSSLASKVSATYLSPDPPPSQGLSKEAKIAIGVSVPLVILSGISACGTMFLPRFRRRPRIPPPSIHSQGQIHVPPHT
ncbi:hypothetical protein QBC35DRAFT_232382 [Podospora australis]|uniref:Uncharacterized protein n=1 Tax=Podospora australis TaxID=1536484 RepID=A0AAN6WUH2_9PEZI|nr:hypothetical protein QBC35DRAFT_232382 [Podospora australis]